jgi:hypothetical protein
MKINEILKCRDEWYRVKFRAVVLFNILRVLNSQTKLTKMTIVDLYVLVNGLITVDYLDEQSNTDVITRAYKNYLNGSNSRLQLFEIQIAELRSLKVITIVKDARTGVNRLIKFNDKKINLLSLPKKELSKSNLLTYLYCETYNSSNNWIHEVLTYNAITMLDKSRFKVCAIRITCMTNYHCIIRSLPTRVPTHMALAFRMGLIPALE